MNFLLDTNICSKVLRDQGKLFSKLIQYSGQLATSRVVLAELYVWANFKQPSGARYSAIEELTRDMTILEFDDSCAREFGRYRRELLGQHTVIDRMDVLIAATALVHDLTLVTNDNDFARIPRLKTVNWLS